MISNVAPNYHWGVTKKQFVFVLSLLCKEYSFGQVQFFFLVWVCFHFACRAKEDTHVFYGKCPSWRIRSLEHRQCWGFATSLNQDAWVWNRKTRWWCQILFIFTPTWGILGTWSHLTNIFQKGWNHQLEKNQQLCGFCVRCELQKFSWLKFHEVIKGTVTLKNSSGSSKEVNLGVGLWRLVDELIGMIFCEFAPCFFYDNFMIGFWWSGDGISDTWKVEDSPKKSFQPLEFSSEKRFSFRKGLNDVCIDHAWIPIPKQPDARCLQELTRIALRTGALNGLRMGMLLGWDAG